MYNICDRTQFCPTLHWCNFFGWILLAQCHFQYDVTTCMQACFPLVFFFFNQCTELSFHCRKLFLGICNFTFPLLLLLWSFRYCTFLLCTFHEQTFLCFKSVFCFSEIKLFKLKAIWGKQGSCLTSVLFYAFLKSMNSRYIPPIDPHFKIFRCWVLFCFAFFTLSVFLFSIFWHQWCEKDQRGKSAPRTNKQKNRLGLKPFLIASFILPALTLF